MSNGKAQRVILGGGCITLVVAMILLALVIACCVLDKIFTI